MISSGPTRRDILVWFALLAAHGALIAALIAGSRTLRIAWQDNQPAIDVLLLPPVQFPRVPSLAPPPHALTVERLNPRMPPLLSNQTSNVPSEPGSSAIGFGAGVDWLAEARRAVRANDIRNQYSAYVSDKAAAKDWWPEVRRAGAQYKMPNGDWIVWINSSCYFLAGADPKAISRMTSTAKVACIGATTARAD